MLGWEDEPPKRRPFLGLPLMGCLDSTNPRNPFVYIFKFVVLSYGFVSCLIDMMAPGFWPLRFWCDTEYWTQWAISLIQRGFSCVIMPYNINKFCKSKDHLVFWSSTTSSLGMEHSFIFSFQSSCLSWPLQMKMAWRHISGLCWEKNPILPPFTENVYFYLNTTL